MPTADVVAETRKGKTVMTPCHAGSPDRAGGRLRRGGGGQSQVPGLPARRLAELSRGQGVQLQRYRDGGLADACTFCGQGLSWAMGRDRDWTRTETDLNLGAQRAGAGRMPPNGFPRDNRF
ncbi:hypothetical protein AB5I41_24095 [Sphingomonas sp. MMS24-JH45]